MLEARITHLAYAPEIASAMLQRQQAGAIIAARSQIVEGAVTMVQMALEDLSTRGVVELDEERKAALVSICWSCSVATRARSRCSILATPTRRRERERVVDPRQYN